METVGLSRPRFVRRDALTRDVACRPEARQVALLGRRRRFLCPVRARGCSPKTEAGGRVPHWSRRPGAGGGVGE